MIKNYLTVALRSLRRRPGYTGINVAGLAVGMACCLLILTFARNEWSYDAFHEDADRIYRVNIHAVTPEDKLEIKAGQPLPLAPQLMNSFGEVHSATRIMPWAPTRMRTGTTTLPQQLLFTDSRFFDVFTFPLLRGDRTGILDDPGSVVLSESAAVRLFGGTDVLGETVGVALGDTFQDFTVTGVVTDFPSSSSITYDVILPIAASSQGQRLGESWSSWVSNTFVRLTDRADPVAFEAGLPAFATQYYEPMIRTWKILQWIGQDEGDFGIAIQPLRDIHFSPEVQQSGTPITDPRYPGFLLALAIAVLLIGSINFTTLSVGRAARRAREVGMRKALGAPRGQLIRQFWGEALLMSILALILSIGLAEALMPAFSGLIGTDLILSYDGMAVGLLAAIVLATALVAGAYPAVYLSRYRPAHILKGGLATGGKNRWMQGLVVLQFTISIGFIIGVFTVSDQLRFLQTKDLGFDDEEVVVVETQATAPDQADRIVAGLREVWSSVPGVQGIAASSSGFNRYLSWGAFGDQGGEAHTVYTNRIDRDFAQVLDLRLVSGQLFTEAFPSDSTSHVLVNEALVREFGWEDPIGQPVNNYGSVAGVVADYHFKSLHEEVEPIVLSLSSRGDDPYRYVYLRLGGADAAQTVQALEAGWTRVEPDKPFSWFFLDDDLNTAYAAERRAQRLISAAAGFAVIIACLGLLGLAAYAAERRTREIGIRKVIGATSFSIVRLLSADFVKLVLLAVVIATPVAWILVQRWLDGFAYRVRPGWDNPLLAAGLAVLIALVTVAGQAFRAANADPVDALHTE